MHNVMMDKYINEFREYCLLQGIREELFMTAENLDRYAETAVDAYREYPLVVHAFGGTVDPDKLFKMFYVDHKSRMNKSLGIAGDAYEAVMIVEPPLAPKTGVLQCLREADIHSLRLLLSRETIEMEHFESFALHERKPFLDDMTWYIYVFATKKAFQRQGHGKKLMRMIRSFADENGYHICLETNLKDNVPMYEMFASLLPLYSTTASIIM